MELLGLLFAILFWIFFFVFVLPNTDTEEGIKDVIASIDETIARFELGIRDCGTMHYSGDAKKNLKHRINVLKGKRAALVEKLEKLKEQTK